MRRISVFLAVFILAGCTTLQGQEQVRVIRDDYGTPHIYADSIYGLYYGYGYSIAQDRLFQMERARRSTQAILEKPACCLYLTVL